MARTRYTAFEPGVDLPWDHPYWETEDGKLDAGIWADHWLKQAEALAAVVEAAMTGKWEAVPEALRPTSEPPPVDDLLRKRREETDRLLRLRWERAAIRAEKGWTH